MYLNFIQNYGSVLIVLFSMCFISMLYMIRCNPMHPLYGALPLPYVPVRVTCGAVIAHRYTHAPPCCRTSQYLPDIYSLVSVSVE